MTKISDLPVNLVEEILSKVPLKYVRAVRLTCKEWDTLTKSRSFSKMHIDKISKGDFSLMFAGLMGYDLYLMKVVLAVNEDPFMECKGKLVCLDKQKQNKISEIFHCDGLLLCVLEDDYTKVIVWNPYLSQTRSIVFRDSVPSNGMDRFSFALGYEDKGSPRRRNYKFLRYVDQCVDYDVEDQFLWYELYDFESSSWKTLDVTTPQWCISFHQCGVSPKGNTYWPASEWTEDALENHMICFDFTSESFGPLLRLPSDTNGGYGDDVILSCVREEKLAVLFTHQGAVPMEFEIWITTKIEAEKVWWSKFLRVVDTELDRPLMSADCFFIDEEKKVTMSFQKACSKTFNVLGEGGYVKKLELEECLGRDIKWMTDACSYVPSLANIKQPAAYAGGNRKQESELEKQRYDHNMARLVALKKRRRVGRVGHVRP